MTDFTRRGRAAAGWPRAGSSFAQDLVQRTLAQHGLALPPSVNSAQAGARPAHADTTALGQGWHADSFACAEGSRRYLAYVPAQARTAASGLILMLHGCTQTPEDFAKGTAMTAHADRLGLVLVYPQQSRGDNMQTCWNWFRRGDQLRDRGEPAILAGMVRKLAAAHGVPAGRICVAGLSAGAAMAVILGETHGDLFAAVGAHSGLPCGAATDVSSAFAAMGGRGTGGRAAAGARAVPTIVLHGAADGTVHPVNGRQILRRVLDLGPAQTIQTEERGSAGGRSYVRELHMDATGAPVAEHWEIAGLGHAWSGGSAQGSYTDTAGPDASDLMVRFFFDRPAAG